MKMVISISIINMSIIIIIIIIIINNKQQPAAGRGELRPAGRPERPVWGARPGFAGYY